MLWSKPLCNIFEKQYAFLLIRCLDKHGNFCLTDQPGERNSENWWGLNFNYLVWSHILIKLQWSLYVDIDWNFSIIGYQYLWFNTYLLLSSLHLNVKNNSVREFVVFMIRFEYWFFVIYFCTSRLSYFSTIWEDTQTFDGNSWYLWKTMKFEIYSYWIVLKLLYLETSTPKSQGFSL